MGNAFLALALILPLAAGGVGCESPPPSGPTEPIGKRIKEYLDGLAQSGQPDSGIIWLEEALTEYAVEHPTEAASLKADYQELSTLRDPSAVKAKAKAMSAKVAVDAAPAAS